MTTTQALIKNFLGNSPIWYKQAIVLFLILNPILLYTAGPVVTGWMLIFEFIFTLALALKCYPLQPGGLLALEAIIIGLASPDTVYHEVQANLEVILLLMFMVAGIYFMKNMLLWVFTKLLLKIHSKIILSLMFSLFAALLSAFLDALTVTAVLISVGVGFYAVYHKVASGKQFQQEAHDHGDDEHVHQDHHDTLNQFRAFLRSLLMHGAVGTALGGVCTLVGEPQNLLIAQKAGWDFVQFFVLMAPVTMPVLFAGLATCMLLEKLKWFGYGADIPASVRAILEDYSAEQDKKLTKADKLALFVQILVAFFLVLALAFHLAAVGLIGLTVIILLTAFNGIVEEHQIGKAFEEALPFTALLVVFFSIVSVIHEQHLFQPIIASVLAMDTHAQPGIFFIANGVLSAISDNVFVATVYINEVLEALHEGSISREHFDLLAIAINTGTNIPSVATPNGQAAFLFLLTSALAPLIRLSYGTMVWMALPYTVVMSLTGYFAVTHFL
ncbi:sodium/proton antiporter NhaB [Amphritea sp. 2_MG-2023]|jgi:NhaB family Na+:H+ antiporter|uniref:sodium/proton antiporter NhaB n=1 Tax=Amphritea TaxID=515417 RepID=UPI001C07263C|nr:MULTISPECIES: sodium/proton antiporter NhaB [Amphritea]MBU2966525.1 sodium/proton antiporter NhaB [Amphritea atlantica]MDO6417616.1 sodium/proton antiporter NhaB [Amphritea sp. 2_MG-2023]MDX2423587.1 sodium/proton antiporter NhaB [Amphritea sp.]